MKAKYVTIGYSAAAIGMIEAVRLFDKKGKILAVTKEPYPAYGRPAIVDYAMGKIDDNGIFYKGEGYSKMRSVDMICGNGVDKIDSKAKKITLSDGKSIEYEKLMIATGGKPISPPIPGKELKGVMHFFNLDEAKAMVREVKEGGARRAVVIGGGLIGLKATEALCSLGVKVTMVELADNILSRSLDPVSIGLMSDKMRHGGVDIFTSTTVEEIIGDDRVRKVRLSNGSEIETDLVYIAIGVSPDVSLCGPSGIKNERGIIVNRRLETNVVDIYAAGDVAKGYNFVSCEDMVIAIWPVARKMGHFVGLNMLGKDAEYDGGMPMNSLYFEDLYTISYGISNPDNPDGYEIIEKLWDDGITYRRFVIKDDKLVGAVYVNDITRAGVARGIIYEGLSVAPFKEKLLRDDFSFVHLQDDYRRKVYTKPWTELEAKLLCMNQA
jgi:NAD(P)H-nitrite reductase large subunit